MSKKIRVGRWDCFVCGHIGNLGPETHCSKCDSSRPKDVVFYLPDDAKIVTEKEEKATAKAGADWICSYCQSHNKTAETVCSTCNNDREVDQEKELEVLDISMEDLPNVGARGITRSIPKAKTEITDKKAGFWKYILSATGLGGVFWWLFGFSTAIEVPVTQMYWEREIEVLQYKEVEEESFDLPQGATDVQQFRAVHHYNKEVIGYDTQTRVKQVKVGERDYVCGQKDMGNGYLEDIICKEPIYESREEQIEVPIYKETPVYKTKYRYHVFRWNTIQSLVASGQDNRPKWPRERPEMTAQPDLFKTGKQREIYKFWIETHKGKTIEYTTKSSETFKSLDVGKILEAEKSTVFGTYKGLKMEL